MKPSHLTADSPKTHGQDSTTPTTTTTPATAAPATTAATANKGQQRSATVNHVPRCLLLLALLAIMFISACHAFVVVVVVAAATGRGASSCSQRRWTFCLRKGGRENLHWNPHADCGLRQLLSIMCIKEVVVDMRIYFFCVSH